MSTYVTRFIELWNKDTEKWELLTWLAPSKFNTYISSSREKKDVDGVEHLVNKYYSDNATGVREYLNDHWSFVKTRLANRGIPKDASEELKTEFAEHTKPSSDGYNYTYNYSHCTLDELEALYEELVELGWKSLEREINAAKMDSIEIKLNKILANQKAISTTSDKKVIPNTYGPDKGFQERLKEVEEENPDGLTYVRDTYSDILDDITGVWSEIMTIHTLVNHVANYTSMGVRITYYFD